MGRRLYRRAGYGQRTTEQLEGCEGVHVIWVGAGDYR
jgi:hypothetical protein